MSKNSQSFCIVCIANYCRSPVAENLLKKRFGDKYEFTKDVFLQSREHSVKDGQVEDEFLSEFEDELFDLDLP